VGVTIDDAVAIADRVEADVVGSRYAQQFERVGLTFFLGGISCVTRHRCKRKGIWEELIMGRVGTCG